MTTTYRGPAGFFAAAFLALATAVPGLSQELADDAEARVESFLAEVAQDRAALERSGFDTLALVDQLDYDPALITGFITAEISFEPYAGVLRGAAGTLMSRAGNSVDTAILLATLLGDAGFEARIARGELTEPEARRLLSRIAAETPSGEAAEIAGSTLFAFARERGAALLDDLAGAGLSLAEPDLPGAVVEEARDYAWVEYRLGAMGDWVPVHPLFDTAPDVTAEGYFTQTVPEDMLHRVSIAMVLESRVGDDRREVRVAGPYTRPAANLNGRLVELYAHPNTFDIATPGQGTLDNLRRATIFTPMLAGEVSGISFDLDGATVETDSLSLDTFGAGGVFRNVAEASGNAADALASMDSPGDGGAGLREMTALWLEITLTAPGGRTEVWRRNLLSPLPDGLAEEDRRLLRAAQITAHHGLMVSASDLPTDYAAERALARIEDSAPMWSAFLSSVDGAPRDLALRDWPGTSPLPHLGTFRLMEQGAEALGAARSYRPAPAVIVVRQALEGLGRGGYGVDVVANPRRSWMIGAEGPLLDPALTLRAGVWETAAEGHYEPQRQPLTGADREEANTFGIFAAAEAAGIAPQIARRADDAGAAMPGAAARAALSQDLAAGYVALLPETVPPGAGGTGWWRVDPDTGTTLGMLSDGRGATATEYMIDNTLMAYNLIKAIKSYRDCDQWPTVEGQTCCLVEAHLNNVGGLGMGGVLGASFGSATVRMCDIGGIVVDAVKTPGPKRNAYECKIFEPGFDPNSLTGPGGVYDPALMGCAGLKLPAPP